MVKYNRLMQHPRTKKWESEGIAILTEQEAETLNSTTNHTGIKYEKAKKTTAKK